MKNFQNIKTDSVVPPKIGEIIEGKIAQKDKSGLFVDLGPKGIGIIYGKEFIEAKAYLKNLKVGDSLTAQIVSLENQDGYRELSLVKATQELAWKELTQAKEKEDLLDAVIKSANKGGLIATANGLDGFLPASQLSPEHYPKVEGADPLKIIAELQKLVGQKIKVRVYDANPMENKLIFSEKSAQREKIVPKIITYKQGDEVLGTISGVTSFGAFMLFDDGIEGLIPPRESSEQKKQLAIGQKIKAKITEIANERIYLSLQ